MLEAIKVLRVTTRMLPKKGRGATAGDVEDRFLLGSVGIFIKIVCAETSVIAFVNSDSECRSNSEDG